MAEGRGEQGVWITPYGVPLHPGSSGSTASSSSTSAPPVTCVYLMSRTAVMVEMSSEEVPSCVTAHRFLNAVLATEELGLTQPTTRSLAANVFALWMCSPLLGELSNSISI